MVAQGVVVGEMPPGKPVLYFELRREGEPVDPSSWLKSTS
jgi:septal ring factor EnvC (AmiA/AmiB activator)